MLMDFPGIMTPFANIAQAEVFLIFIDKAQVFGMKVRSVTGIEVVFHMHPREPKLVDTIHFINRDVLALRDVSFRFPEIKQAKAGSPDTYAYGSAILSAKGLLVRAAHANGPFDVELGNGVAQQSRNDLHSIWFDTWEVVQSRGAEQHVLFSHNATKVIAA